MSRRRARRCAAIGVALHATLVAVPLAACSGEVNAASAPTIFRDRTAPHVSVAAAPTAEVPPRRVEIALSADGIEADLAAASIPAALVDVIDEAFVGRVDLFARARAATRLTLWVRDTPAPILVGAKLDMARDASIFAARYDGPLAPAGFYDAAGLSMNAALRARPVALRRITSRFGSRFDAFTGKAATHHGIDYGVPVGTPVMSVGRGRVAAVGHSRRAGNFITLAHADGYESFYLHLDAVDDALRIGSVVAQGEQIATSGNTGRSTGPHLHYELHVAGIPVDPLAVLPMPTVALGPLARRQHLAFMKQLEDIR